MGCHEDEEIRSRYPGHLVSSMIFPYLHCTISTCRSSIEEERELDNGQIKKKLEIASFSVQCCPHCHYRLPHYNRFG
jgi:hypothetical protein